MVTEYFVGNMYNCEIILYINKENASMSSKHNVRIIIAVCIKGYKI